MYLVQTILVVFGPARPWYSGTTSCIVHDMVRAVTFLLIVELYIEKGFCRRLDKKASRLLDDTDSQLSIKYE